MPTDQIGLSDDVIASIGRGGLFDDSLEITGRLVLEVFGPDGELKQREVSENLVVTAGKNHIAAAMSSGGATAMGWMAVGTSSTAPAAGDTALGAEIATTGRQALTSRTASTNVVTYVGDWAAGQATNATILEAGIFNAASAGTMLARATFSNINKAAADTLKITWTNTYS